MSTTTTTRSRAAVLVIAPALMLAGLVYHPRIGDPVDADFLARLGAAVVADPTRWAVAHLAVAVASGLMILAALAVRGQLREAGEERRSGLAMPFIVLGSTLYALLPAMEFTPLAAAAAGADPAALQGALLPWFAPILFISAIVFVVGAVLLALGIARSGIMDTRPMRIVTTALVVMAAARLVPLSAVQFYVQGVAGIVALWPLAYVAGRQPPMREAPQSSHAAGAIAGHG